MEQYLILKNCSQVLTCPQDENLGIGLLENISILIKNELIKEIGSYEKIKRIIPKNIIKGQFKEINCKGKVILPGFVDSHTHLVFGGDRRKEYVASLPSSLKDRIRLSKKVTRKGLEESIYLTKKASKEELIKSSLEKIQNMIINGTTSIEIKSGYGIDLETEIKQLQVINELKKISPLDIASTYLGAHYWDVVMGKEKYIEFMIQEVIPQVEEESLAEYIDVWVDEGYYSVKEAEKIITAAMNYKMKGKLHTDAYSAIGGSELAAEMKMTSGDHLNYIQKEGMRKMARNCVTGVLLPGTDFSMKHPFPFRPLIMKENGMRLALATNLNPGNYMLSMVFVMVLATRIHGMSTEDAIRGTTINGAFALNKENEIGSIEIGKKADIQIWDTCEYENIIYQYGKNFVQTVIKSGKIILDKRME